MSMTNKDLKAILEGYDDDMLVVVDGYESGAESLDEDNIELCLVGLDLHHDEEWKGTHGYCSCGYPELHKKEPIEVLRIGRPNHPDAGYDTCAPEDDYKEEHKPRKPVHGLPGVRYGF